MPALGDGFGDYPDSVITSATLINLLLPGAPSSRGALWLGQAGSTALQDAHAGAGRSSPAEGAGPQLALRDGHTEHPGDGAGHT